jgi:hypothetical protein
MAALGLLKVLHELGHQPRLGFLSDGSFSAFVDGKEDDLPGLVAADAASPGNGRTWWLQYEKQEKKGKKVVADLKAPPQTFEAFLRSCVEQWLAGNDEAAAYGAAFGTSVAVDGKGNTKPTAFHFTAANQQFLGTLETIRATVTREWAARSLFEGYATRHGSNLRWDPSAERNWALMATDPNDEGTSVDAPLEWLAFRGLALVPTLPDGRWIVTTTVSGRGEDMTMTWPLWSVPASLHATRSVLQLDWTGRIETEKLRGVFAVCQSAIRRTSQGFGNFGPATVTM